MKKFKRIFFKRILINNNKIISQTQLINYNHQLNNNYTRIK